MNTGVNIRARTLRRIERSPLPPAVVVGADINGLGVARALECLGVPVIAVDAMRHRFASFSGAFDLLLCADFDTPDMVRYLDRLASALPRRAALFLTMDRHVTLMSEHGDVLRNRYHFLFPDRASVQLLMNKARFAARAEREGWPVPRALVIRDGSDLEQARGMRFPVILKPAVKSAAFASASPAKVFRCADFGALRRAHDLVAQWEVEQVVQEWIPAGDDGVQFSFHFLDHELREVSSFEGRKIRQWVPECGSTSSAVGVPTEEISLVSRKILRATGCVGFGSIEYKRNEDSGRFLIMEATVGRTNLQYGVALANGVNIVARAYFHLIGQPYPRTEHPTHDHKWVIFLSDLRSARYWMRRGKLTWAGYFASLWGPLSFSVWRAGDWRLHLRALAELVRIAVHVLRRLLPGEPKAR